MRFPDKATVPSDMSLDLHFGCRFSPGCGGLVHLHLAGQASATLRKIRLTCKKTVKLHQWLTRFQIATERCKKSCKSAIHCRFLPPLSGQPEGYRNYLPRTATCPRNNRQPVNSLETDRFEHIDIILIKQYCISHCIMLIVTFSVISGTVTVCMIC